jgi:hypothetical protein
VSHTISGDETNNPASVTVADDGDPPQAADVEGPIQACLDKIEYVIKGATVFSGVKHIAGDPPVWEYDDNPGFVRVVGGTAIDETAALKELPATLAVSPARLRWELDLPHGAQLVEFFCNIDPASGTAAATRTSLQVKALARDGSGFTTPVNVQDTTTGASYVAAHEAVFDASGATIDNVNNAYFVQLTGETGANSGNVSVRGPLFVHFTLPAKDFGR